MILSARALTLGYKGLEPVLRNIDVGLTKGELVSLIGPNGSGKSTLIRGLLGLHPADSGAVHLAQQPIASHRRSDVAKLVAYVPQRLTGLPPFTLHELVSQGRHPHRTSWFESAEDLAKVEEAMRQTGTWDLRNRKFHEVSGGEAQRAMIAAALCQEPSVLLLDEPTSALDMHYGTQLFELLAKLRTNDVAVLVATHDLNLASLYSDRLVLLSNGTIHAEGPPQHVMTEERLARVYGPELCVVPHPTSGAPVVLPRGGTSL